jgi:hypothetical protein
MMGRKVLRSRERSLVGDPVPEELLGDDEDRPRDTPEDYRRRVRVLALRRQRASDDYTHRMVGPRRAAEAGNLSGLYDALVFTLQRDIDVRRKDYWGRLDRVNPTEEIAIQRWLLDLLVKYVGDELSSRSCPTARWRKKWNRDMRALDLAYAVDAARDQGAKWTDGDVYVKAAEVYVSGKTPGQLEGAYKRVRRLGKKHPGRYYIPTFVRVRDKK